MLLHEEYFNNEYIFQQNIHLKNFIIGIELMDVKTYLVQKKDIKCDVVKKMTSMM